MPQLVVRNLAPWVVAQLERRAAANGCSAEEEHRRILEHALTQPAGSSLKELLLAIPPGDDQGDFERPRDRGRMVEL